VSIVTPYPKRTATKTPVPMITPDADPAKNNWNLDVGDPAPGGWSTKGTAPKFVGIRSSLD